VRTGSGTKLDGTVAAESEAHRARSCRRWSRPLTDEEQAILQAAIEELS
jgi:hypothetical protein